MFENRKAESALGKLTPALDELDKSLIEVEAIRDPIDRIVGFFRVVAPWHDREHTAEAPVRTVLNMLQKADKGGRYAGTIQALQTLQAHFRNGGRDEYGMNRTKAGQEISIDDVYLGNVSGRFTRTARDWRNAFSKDTPTAQEDQQIIESQAAGFVSSHVGAMHRLIGALKR
jgi:hypothetical protein